MKFRIGTVLPLIIAALVTMGMLSAGLAAYRAWETRWQSSSFLEINQIAQLLLRSGGQWAIERGMTNTALRTPEPAAAERRAEIAKLRASSDGAFRQAVQLMGELPAMKDAKKSIAEAEEAFQAMQARRAKVDENLAKPAPEREAAVVDSWVPTATRLIDVGANRLRLTMETLTTPPTAALAQFVNLRHLAAQMAEYAGQERAMLAGTIAARAKLAGEGIRKVSEARGQVRLAWDTLVPVAQRADVPAAVRDAVSGVQSQYFGAYGETREAVIAAGATGEYRIGSADFFAQATAGINTILRLAEAIGGTADQMAQQEASASLYNLLVSLLVLLACGGLAAVGFWVAFSRIVRPLSSLTAAMTEVAGGNLATAVPGLGRKDEVGDMARALEVFRGALVAKKAADEAASRDAAAKIERAQRVDALTSEFESAVGEIVEAVSSASTELEASAATLTSTADRSERLAKVVSTASEEAATNVQSVASATEELSSSVNEISRQVQESARMASEAVGQARTTNDRVGELSKAAARIGDVVELINTIAGQTNLLALNATIEAARAGEAGRGFAVVASEVKALAEQTAKATGEISQQIAGIQGATQESVSAIREISGTIERLSEISSAIAAAVEEQGAATQEISRNVQLAAQGTMQVSSNITDVERGATETGSASSQVLSAAQMLSGDSTRLKTEVSKFLDTVRAA